MYYPFMLLIIKTKFGMFILGVSIFYTFLIHLIYFYEVDEDNEGKPGGLNETSSDFNISLLIIINIICFITSVYYRE